MCTVSFADIQSVSWLPESHCSYTDDLAVFRFQLPDHTDLDHSLNHFLRADERQRAQRYHQKNDIRRYLYTRSLLKVVCGNYISQHPSSIEFTVGESNKPELSGNTGWHFNVSHSGSWILLGIGRVQVGVDIEKIDPQFRFEDLLATSFIKEDQKSIQAYTDSKRRFYQLWTRKEALVKATGKGMDHDFGQVPSLDGRHVVARNLIGGAGNWLVRSFAVADDYSASVAYQQMETAPKFYNLDCSLLENLFRQDQ